jgi:precorrin-2 dehydrogenase/sirohydrochlorin ferrochelatase
LNITGKICVVVGGGTVAERKINGLLAEHALVRVISPVVTASVKKLFRNDACEWLQKNYVTGDLAGAFLVFAATDAPKVQQLVVDDAQQQGILVNVIDNPEMCSFQVPATVRRGDLTLAVSTGGKSPAVAAMVRQRLEEQYGVEYERLLQLMGVLRPQIIAIGESSDQRKILFKKILHDDIIKWIRDGRYDRVQSHLQDVLGSDLHFEPTLSQLEKIP